MVEKIAEQMMKYSAEKPGKVEETSNYRSTSHRLTTDLEFRISWVGRWPRLKRPRPSLNSQLP